MSQFDSICAVIGCNLLEEFGKYNTFEEKLMFKRLKVGKEKDFVNCLNFI